MRRAAQRGNLRPQLGELLVQRADYRFQPLETFGIQHSAAPF
jgi:hypothetical protein